MGGVDDPVARYDRQIDNNMKKRFKSVEQRASEYGIAVDLLHEIDDLPAEAIIRTTKLKAAI